MREHIKVWWRKVCQKFSTPFWAGFFRGLGSMGHAFVQFPKTPTRRPFLTPTKRPSFKGGFARDRQALAGDWKKVGDDMRVAIEKVKQEIPNVVILSEEKKKRKRNNEKR